jgi:hypothetical protein
MPRQSDFMRMMSDGGRQAVSGQFYRCAGCSHLYVFEDAKLRSGGIEIKAFDLTSKTKTDYLLPSCVENNLMTADSMSIPEAKNYAEYVVAQRKTAARTR